MIKEQNQSTDSVWIDEEQSQTENHYFPVASLFYSNSTNLSTFTCKIVGYYSPVSVHLWLSILNRFQLDFPFSVFHWFTVIGAHRWSLLVFCSHPMFVFHFGKLYEKISKIYLAWKQSTLNTLKMQYTRRDCSIKLLAVYSTMAC